MKNFNVILYIFLIIICFGCKNSDSVNNNLCTLIIAHDECTGCKDFVIDSGEVKIADTILAKFKPYKISMGGGKYRLKTQPNLLDFKISDKTLFDKMWKGVVQINSFGDTLNYDFSRKYRIKGWIVNFDTSGNTYFKIKEYTLLDSVYALQFNDEN